MTININNMIILIYNNKCNLKIINQFIGIGSLVSFIQQLSHNIS